MKATTRLFSILLALLSVAIVPQARATCQDACLTGNNTVQGDDALINNTGASNTAIGFQSLFSNTTGGGNTAVGFKALYTNTINGGNTAVGNNALMNNIQFGNSAVGAGALQNNTSGVLSTAIGFEALLSNTTGFNNVAVGNSALEFNTGGYWNTALGSGALFFSTGIGDTAVGDGALQDLTSGDSNTAVGLFAMGQLTTGSGNTAIDGLYNLETGNDNIAVGTGSGHALTHGDNNIYIGNAGTMGENRKIRIGTTGTHANAYIAGISGVTVPGGVGVIINTQGQLGTVVSSERFKADIKPMDKASEALLALKPVTFRYKHDLDPEGIPQFGLVAEEVEKISPALVARDEEGKPYTVRYEAVNAMLLNEFLKEHGKVEKLESTIVQQQKEFQATVAELRSAIKAEAAQIQKVSAKVEMNKPVLQTIANHQ